MDSRVKFWTIREGWPRDTASHVFLGNAVNEIGKALFGSEWNGAEPCVESLFSWPKGKLKRFGITNEQVASDHAAKRSALERFSRVQDQIIQFAETEKLITALRPDAGGDPVAIHRSFWNSERLSVRFYRCQMNPRDPFAVGVAGDGYCWIFVTRESLQDCLAFVRGGPSEIPADARTPSELIVDAKNEIQKISIKARAEKFKEWRESRGDNIPSEREDIAHMKPFGVGRDAVRELRRNAPKLPRGRRTGRTPK
jgi:hypothetical protein